MQVIVLVGCYGSGKDLMCQILEGAYPNVTVVSMSALLDGGTSDGSRIDCTHVNQKLFDHLDSLGFRDQRKPQKTFVLQGVGRTGFQMKGLINYLRSVQLIKATKFCKLNISIQLAMGRMWGRYQENLKTGRLRKEESEDAGTTRENFLRRIRDWSQTRVGIFEEIKKSGAQVLEINATSGPEVVAFDLLTSIGFDPRPGATFLLHQSINENEGESAPDKKSKSVPKFKVTHQVVKTAATT